MKRAIFVILVLLCVAVYLLLFLPPDWAVGVVVVLAMLAAWVGVQR